jgi:hypothetical protein
MACSADGDTWTEITDHGFTNAYLNVAYGGGRFVAVSNGRIAYCEY